MGGMEQNIATPGLLERLTGKWAGKLIVFSATRAAKRGDWHEVNHAFATIVIGNTGKANYCRACDEQNLPPDHSQHLTHGNCIFHDLTRRQVEALVESLVRGDLSTPAGDPVIRS